MFRRWLGLEKKKPKAENLLEAYLAEAKALGPALWKQKASDLEEGRRIAALPLAEQIPYVLATVKQGGDYTTAFALHALREELLSQPLPFAPESLAVLAEGLADFQRKPSFAEPILATLEDWASRGPLPDNAVEVLRRKAGVDVRGADAERVSHRIFMLVGDGQRYPIFEGEAWGDRARQDLDDMEADTRKPWLTLFRHTSAATKSKPSRKWEKAASGFLEDVGRELFTEALRVWLPLVDRRRSIPSARPEPWGDTYDQMILAPHQDILKGLVWIAGVAEITALASTLTDLAISTYRKVPAHGARAPAVGNACVFALGRMPEEVGVSALARLKVRVRHRALQNTIAKTLEAAADRAGVSTDELEEMSVPTFGLTDVGLMTEELGQHQAVLHVTGTTTTELRFVGQNGKSIKSVPTKVKEDFPDDLKDLKSTAKEIQKLLPAHRERIDHFLLTQRTWDVATWRERYLDHPLIGTLARRLIWAFKEGEETRSAIHSGDGLCDVAGEPISISESAVVSLWHPIDHSVEEALGWREFLETREIQQPFKQAHREVYVLTDAERSTGFYSNRYAAHILKQHQFNALCKARGWSNSLRLAVDADYPPAHVSLPEWGLRAEYWIEGMHGDGTEVNDAGVYHYLGTDQVRFYPAESEPMRAHAGGGGYSFAGWRETEESEPIPLSEIPARVFSEVMRDVDLFVGVSSVANDPTWNDGGPEGHRAYWEEQSFGSLAGTAKSRRELLERLIPRLKIASRCSFTDRFLVVKGDLRTYKIHFGSGNILMEPNDEYLCIVPKASALTSATGKVFLPFEGDRTLAIVLSKAFMLADDRKIKDLSILTQIRE